MGFFSRIVALLKQAWETFDDRTGTSQLIGPIMTHPVPEAGRKGWFYVFGSATLFSFIVQVVTGIALATAYIPASGEAYQSLQFISDPVNGPTLGPLLRGIHNYGASAMVVLIGVHALRVFLMGSYKYPREFSWLSGSVLLLLTLGMAFTGQLLRWDQTAFWSVIVAAEQAGRAPLIGPALAQFILGGSTVGGATLSRFYAFHVFFIPALIFGLIGFHLYMVLHVGISEPPQAGRPVDPKTYRKWYHDMLQREGVPFWPDAAWRDAIFGVLVIVTIVALAFILGPPKVDIPPDPTLLNAYPRPDWYLLWYFAALALLPPESENWVIIGGPLVLGLVLFLLPLANRGERHPKRRPWAIGLSIVVVLMIASLSVVGQISAWSPDFKAQPLSPQVVASNEPSIIHGAQLFNSKGCQACHAIAGSGGARGPDLTAVGSRLTRDQLVWRILNGGVNMPAFANNMTPEELTDIVNFLETRRGTQASSP
ncbi:MAG TPA: cytochrome b N-terminal domain-containing protein [Chloroflexia bacterium]|nr:cytochrome b N-terminal domain-containing protein [Chloroflexia bacterium]